MDFRPINKFICVKPEPVLNKSEAGIVFVEKESAKPSRGLVVRASASATVKEGDTILYVQGSGEKVKLGDQTYVIMDDEKVVGIVK